jgi:hypothetical protein
MDTYICKQCHKQYVDYVTLANHFAVAHPWLFMDIVEWIDITTPVEYIDYGGE